MIVVCVLYSQTCSLEIWAVRAAVRSLATGSKLSLRKTSNLIIVITDLFASSVKFPWYTIVCQIALSQAFFLTPLGRSGEGQSSETLSFFLEFWVFFLSFEFSLEFFGFFLIFFLISFKNFTKGLLIFTFWKNLAIKMA